MPHMRSAVVQRLWSFAYQV